MPKGHRGFELKFTDEMFLAQINEIHKTTTQVAKVIGCSHYYAEVRLKALAEGGEIEKIKQIARGRENFKYMWVLKYD